MERIARDKRSSLFQKFIIYGRKKSYNFGARSQPWFQAFSRLKSVWIFPRKSVQKWRCDYHKTLLSSSLTSLTSKLECFSVTKFFSWPDQYLQARPWLLMWSILWIISWLCLQILDLPVKTSRNHPNQRESFFLFFVKNRVIKSPHRHI
jgi:hypothetical protein